MLPSHLIFPTPTQRADLHVCCLRPSESLHHPIRWPQLSHKVFPDMGYTPQTLVVDPYRLGIGVELSSSFGCDCCLCLHREDCRCKGGPPWPPTCLFPVDSTVCVPMVALGRFCLLQDPIPKVLGEGFNGTPASQPCFHHQ